PSKTKGRTTKCVVCPRLSDRKNQTRTPSPGTSFFHLSQDRKGGGRGVPDIPPAGDEGSITGSVDDAWQTAIEDVGPAGVDAGKGGMDLIPPPGDTDAVPAGLALRVACRDGRLAFRAPVLTIFEPLGGWPCPNRKIFSSSSNSSGGQTAGGRRWHWPRASSSPWWRSAAWSSLPGNGCNGCKPKPRCGR